MKMSPTSSIIDTLWRREFVRKIILTPSEKHKYMTIKAIVSKKKSVNRAAVELDLTARHVRRLKNNYLKDGKVIFQHGNHKRHTRRKFTTVDKNKIINLYHKKYFGFNITHFVEFLNEYEGISISYSSVKKIFNERNIVTPKTQKRTMRQIKKKLEGKVATSSTVSKRDLLTLQNIGEVEPLKAHPSRSRKKYFGELLQMDASEDYWFGTNKYHLHIAIDDSTGRIVGAYFDVQETLNGYYQVLSQVLYTYGIPYKILTDNRTVFEYKRKAHPITTSDTLTNFGYACQNLGIELSTTSIPQAKGRVERLFETLQSRLINELRLTGIDNKEDANRYLIDTFVKKYNDQFGLPIKDNTNIFESQLSNHEIEMNLIRMEDRVINKGHSIKFETCLWSLFDDHKQVMLAPGTTVSVIKTYTNKYYATVKDSVYELEKIPEHEKESPSIDYIVKTTVKRKRTIPAINHPWRQYNRKKYEHNNQLKYAIAHG